MAATSAAGSLRGKVATDFYRVDPEEVFVITDPKHPLYDERVHMPTPQWLIDSIAAKGVRTAITIRKNGDRLEVVVGRQRVRAARLVNKQRKAQGLKPIRIPAYLERGVDDKNLISDIITENEHRTPDEILVKASKAARAIRFGSSIGEVAKDFRVTPETVENWLKLLDLHPKISAAVARGEVKYTVAMRLARLPRQRQLSKYQKLKKAKLTNANALRVVVGGKLERVVPPSKNQLRRVADKFHEGKLFLESSTSSDVYSFMSWVLGRMSTNELLDCLSASVAGPISTIIRQVMAEDEKKEEE
jgi:ParB family chromosome partitioning protein